MSNHKPDFLKYTKIGLKITFGIPFVNVELVLLKHE